MAPLTAIALSVCITVGLVAYNGYVSNPEESITPSENKVQENNVVEQEALLDERCGSGITCVDPKTTCSDVCVCKEQYVNTDGACLLKASLDEHCGIGIKCIDSKAYCSDDVCVCEAGYANSNGNCLLKASLDEPCGVGIKCIDPNTTCLDVCICDTDYVNIDGNCLLKASLDEPCGAGIKCTDCNTYCSDDVCVCEQEFVPVDGVCQLGVPDGGSCSVAEECSACTIGYECSDVAPPVACTNGTCTCEEKVFAAYGLCYSIIYNDTEVLYDEAEATCNGFGPGAHLVTVPSEEVQLYLISKTDANQAWFGLREEDNEHKWRTGETLKPSDHQPWHSEGHADLEDDRECIRLRISYNTWQSLNCTASSSKEKFFCMIPAGQEQQ